MTTRLQIRGDTSANWIAANPRLSIREPGIEIDTGNLKIGDGVSYWNDLQYANHLMYEPENPNIQFHIATDGNPHNTTASDIGAQPALVSGTNIKTINGVSVLGPGNITVAADTGVTQEPSDWNATSGVTRILNKPTIPTTPSQVNAEPANINIQTHVTSVHAPVPVTFTQAIASDTWTITHNMNKYPSVVVIDSAGNSYSVFSDVEYASANTLILHFSAAFAGSAYLN